MDSCLILSTPRAGTHLVMRLLHLLGMKEHPYSIKTARDNIHTMPIKDHYCFTSHMPCTEGFKTYLDTYKGIFITRDWKDAAVSLTKDMVSNSGESFEEKLKVITKDLEDRYARNEGWEREDEVYPTTFEKLIGTKGGGNDQNQKREIIAICKHLKISFNGKILNYCKKELYGHDVPSNNAGHISKSFRIGKIGTWEEYKRLFK